MAAAAEAVAVNQRLAAANPSAHTSRLAVSLAGVAGLRAETRQDLERARWQITEALGIGRRLTEEAPADVLAGMAKAAQGAAARLVEVLETLDRTAEATELRRLLDDGAPSHV